MDASHTVLRDLLLDYLRVSYTGEAIQVDCFIGGFLETYPNKPAPSKAAVKQACVSICYTRHADLADRWSIRPGPNFEEFVSRKHPGNADARFKVLVIDDEPLLTWDYRVECRRDVQFVFAQGVEQARQRFALTPDINLIVMSALVIDGSTLPLVREFRRTFSGPIVAIHDGGDGECGDVAGLFLRSGCDVFESDRGKIGDIIRGVMAEVNSSPDMRSGTVRQRGGVASPFGNTSLPEPR